MTGNGVDTDSGAASENRDGDDPDPSTGTDERPSLATYVRDAAERGESEEELTERVRASYEFDVSPRRAKRLVEIERERLETTETEFVVREHAPRYADLDDLGSLTDAEFGRVVAYLLNERDGRGEIASAPDSAGSPDDGADTAVEAGDNRGDGTEIRRQRAEGVMLVRAVAAEPGRVVDADLVCRVRETARAVRATPTAKPGDTDGEHDGEHATRGSGGENNGNDNDGSEGHEPADTVIVTVADVVPGAMRLAVRSGIEIYDRAAVRRWLDETRLDTETFGSLIDRS